MANYRNKEREQQVETYILGNLEEFTNRFNRYILKVENGCWAWSGTITNGYAVIGIHSKPAYVHRISYYLKHGVWPNITRHRCGDRSCVNPDHLLSGNHKDNANDAVEDGTNHQIYKKTCPFGHPYTRNQKKNRRECRVCEYDRLLLNPEQRAIRKALGRALERQVLAERSLEIAKQALDNAIQKVYDLREQEKRLVWNPLNLQ